MAKLIINESFVVEVPKSDGTLDRIDGKLKPETNKFIKQLEQQYKENTSKAKSLQKKTTQLLRLQSKIENISTRIDLSDDTQKLEMLNKKEDMQDQAFALSDEIENLRDHLQSQNPEELRAKAHIEGRTIFKDEDTKNRFIDICEQYGYKLVFDTILKDIEDKGKQDTRS